MMDIQLIEESIENLESSDTNFSNCADLASLYIVRNYYKPTSRLSDVESELNDISPSYQKYQDIKRKYQLGEGSQSLVYDAMRNVCREITEFILTLYSSTDTKEERELLINSISRTLEKVR